MTPMVNSRAQTNAIARIVRLRVIWLMPVILPLRGIQRGIR